MRGGVCAVVAGLVLGLVGPAAGAGQQPADVLLVHGYGDARAGQDCNGQVWRDALEHSGRARQAITTIGYYAGDRRAVGHGPGCDAVIGDGAASNTRPIEDLARDLARYIDRHHGSRPVNVVGHSMGGLIARVALLGSARGWPGFPPRLEVDNVVALGAPYRGLGPAVLDAHHDPQWDQMKPGSAFLQRMHAEGELGQRWAAGTDWTLVGSEEDWTVPADSALDGEARADQKYRYRVDDASGRDRYEVHHYALRTHCSGEYHLRSWRPGGPVRETSRGPSPVRVAFQAAAITGDGLPE